MAEMEYETYELGLAVTSGIGGKQNISRGAARVSVILPAKYVPKGRNRSSGVRSACAVGSR